MRLNRRARASAPLSVEHLKRAPTGEISDLPITVWTQSTIRKIQAGVAQHVVGNFGPASILAEWMLGDDHIQSATNGRLTRDVSIHVRRDSNEVSFERYSP